MIGEGILSATRYSPTHFSIDTTNAGQGTLVVELTDEIGNTLPLRIVNESDPDIYDVEYQPNTAGPVYNCSVLYDSVHVPGSPFQITIKPDIDISKVFVEHLETSESLDQEKKRQPNKFILNRNLPRIFHPILCQRESHRSNGPGNSESRLHRPK